MRVNRPSKRIVISAIAVLALALASLYIWQSLSAWQTYDERPTSEKRTYERLKTEAIETGSPEARLKAIRALDDRMAVRGTLCHIHSLYAWQSSIVPVLRDGINRCQVAVRQLDTLTDPLKDLRQYLDAAEKVQSVVSGLSPPGGFNEQNWEENGLARAKKFQKEAQELKGDGDSVKLNDQTKQLADGIVRAWEALLRANASKDKIGYEAAASAVLKAYADLTGLADTADAAIQQKVAALIKASP